MTTYIVFLLIGLLCTPVVWSQSDTVSQAPLPEIEYSAHRKVYEIADIAVTGADSYEDYVIIGFSGLAVGDKVEVPGNQITKAVRRFWKQGLFSEVRIVATKMTDKQVWLEIQLKQRPRISELEYRGMKKSEREDVETKVGIARGNQMTPNLADRAKTVIKKYYEEKGYHNADVRIIEQPDQEHKGYVKVYIDVDKREKTKVAHLYITGNKALSHNQINLAMKKTNDNNIMNLFRTKKFVEKEYENDKKAVIEKYNELGYRDAYIVADSVVPNPED
ncbi:MAG: outer membrane protein assembly factor BamA, partial [Paludibacteraceae bacterium]|nr:outer membrane protein assembly factor BamA [Paludibacteraceae bacterium]